MKKTIGLIGLLAAAAGVMVSPAMARDRDDYCGDARYGSAYTYNYNYGYGHDGYYRTARRWDRDRDWRARDSRESYNWNNARYHR
jgi:hypothetical protein